MVLSLNNSKFGYFVNHIYSTELEIKDIRDTARSASFHDIQLEIDSENRLIMKHHDKKLFQFTLETFGLVASLLATTLYQGNYDRNHKSGISYQLRDTYSI
jgi:hypothetical protein